MSSFCGITAFSPFSETITGEIKNPTLSLLISSCERREGSGADTSDEPHKINSHSNNFPLIFFFFPLVYLSLIYKNSVSFLFFFFFRVKNSSEGVCSAQPGFGPSGCWKPAVCTTDQREPDGGDER